ncbi:MAG: hypothetical protein Q8N63_05640 [Nanoarchaeota archaeon]|nr:hypothetical protein [Nanoarchaeota archaeon]
MVGQLLRNKLASMALAVLALVPSVGAKDKNPANPADCAPIPQERTIEIDIAHPFDSFDSRANFNYSANELAGKGLDYLGKNGLDKESFGRAAKTASEAYAAYLFSYITHEAGHDGADTEFLPELRPGTLTPKVKNLDLPLTSSLEKSAHFSRGVNQNTFNAETILENAVLNNAAPGVSFPMNSLYTSFYHPNEATRETGQTTDDLEAYSEALNERGFKTSKRKIQKNALIANVLTLQNWKSIYDAFRFIGNGQRADAPLTFQIRDIEFTSPAIFCYLGETGNFYNTASFINPKSENPILVSAGIEQDAVRFGGKVHDISTPLFNLTVSPSAYVNFGKEEQPGLSLGIDLNYKLNENSSLKLALQQNERDLMSKIKETNGFSARAEFAYRF